MDPDVEFAEAMLDLQLLASHILASVRVQPPDPATALVMLAMSPHPVAPW